MFTKLAASVVRHPGWVILGWVALIGALVGGVFAVYGPEGPKTSTAQTDFLPSSYDSVQAARIGAHSFPVARGASAVMVVWRFDGAALSRTDRTRITRLSHELTSPGVAAVSAGPIAGNGLIQLNQVRFTADAQDKSLPPALTALRTKTRQALAGSGLSAGYTGEAAVAADSVSTNALVSAGMIAGILFLLLIIFRSPTIALINVFVVTLLAQGATSALAIGAKIFGYHLDSTTTGILPVVLFGVGTDYVVFLLFRYREQLRLGVDKRTSMIRAVSGVGEAVGVSALVVAVSFSALLLSGFGSFRVLGPALAFAVLFMVAAGLTLMPAVYCLLGRKAYWPARLRQPRAGLGARVARLVARRPAGVAAACVLVLGLLGLGTLSFVPSYDSDATPPGSESAHVLQTLKSGFGAGMLSPTSVYLSGPGVNRYSVRTFAEHLTKVAIVARVSGIDVRHRVARVDLVLSKDPSSDQAMDALATTLRPAAEKATPPGTHAVVGGQTATLVDVRTVLNHDLPIVFAVAALLIGLLLIVMLRGLLAPVYLLGAVALGFFATLGTSTLVFHGLAGHSGLSFQLPLIVYLFVAAIGTDYNVLMIARIREEIRAGHDARTAAAEAVRQAGPAVAAAGIILAGSFAVLTASPSLTEIGFAVAVGILLSTFVLSWLLVPSLSALLGRCAFWPARTSAIRDSASEYGDQASAMTADSAHQLTRIG